MEDAGKRVFSLVAEGFASFKRSFVVSNQVRELFEDQDQANGSQHSFDNGIRYIIAQNTRFDHPKDELEKAGYYYRQQKGFIDGQFADGCGNDNGQTGGRSAHTKL